jgi:hypothetical protein
MCLIEKTLVLSHLMPASVYDYLRAGDLPPIKIGNGMVISTDRQTRDHLLCQTCEEVLNKGGENWLNSKFARMERIFPLYDLVVQGPPDVMEKDGSAYRVALNPEIDGDKILHFACGLFWKASVHSWSGLSKEPRIDLGPYSEKLRKFLRGDAPFPPNMMLNVSISTPSTAQVVMLDPREGERAEGERTYYTYLPGVLFVLTVGKAIPAALREVCFAANSGRPILVSDGIALQLGRMAAGALARSRKTKSFLEARERRNSQAGNDLLD